MRSSDTLSLSMPHHKLWFLNLYLMDMADVRRRLKIGPCVIARKAKTVERAETLLEENNHWTVLSWCKFSALLYSFHYVLLEF